MTFSQRKNQAFLNRKIRETDLVQFSPHYNLRSKKDCNAETHKLKENILLNCEQITTDSQHRV